MSINIHQRTHLGPVTPFAKSQIYYIQILSLYIQYFSNLTYNYVA